MRTALAAQRYVLMATLAILACIAFAYKTVGPEEEPVSTVPAQEAGADAPVVLSPLEHVDVPILVYHHVTPSASGPAGTRVYELTPEEFAAQMDLIAELGYMTITVADLVDALDGRMRLPEKPVVITLDDGRSNQYAHAFPILVEHGFTAVVYPFTNAIGRENYLTWEQLGEMRDAGFEIGSHTRYHPYLTKETDEDLATELAVSKAALEEHLGITVRSIAWPFGLVDARVIAAAEAAGYEVGRGLEHGRMQETGMRMDLKAYIVPGGTERLREILDR